MAAVLPYTPLSNPSLTRMPVGNGKNHEIRRRRQINVGPNSTCIRLLDMRGVQVNRPMEKSIVHNDDLSTAEVVSRNLLRPANWKNQKRTWRFAALGMGRVS